MTRLNRRACSGRQRLFLLSSVVLFLLFSSGCVSFDVALGLSCLVYGVPGTNCSFTVEHEDGSETMTTIRFDSSGVALVEDCAGFMQSCSPSSSAGG